MFTVKTSKGPEYKISFKHNLGGGWVRSRDEFAREITECFLLDDDQEPLGMGLAHCSFDDVFSYEIGRRISLTRAIEGLPRDERKEIWAAYWAKKAADRKQSAVAEFMRYEKALSEKAEELAELEYSDTA